MSVPSAVVCLPTYNERENLEKMVRALGDKGVNVLVVDDNSPDGTSRRSSFCFGRAPRS